MNKKSLYKKNDALAGVIEALLLVALVSIVLSVIQLQYIPQVMEQREAEHMDEVSNQFSTLKSMMDLQAITNSSTPIFSMLTLGSRELPYFISIGSSGEIFVNEDSEYKIDMLPPLLSFPLGIPVTSLEYAADNAYFVDQTYSIECGSIIVNQPTGDPVMRVDPPILVENEEYDINIYWNVPILVGVPGKNSTSGIGKCFIRTNWSQTGYDRNNNVTLVNISTKYPAAWYTSLYALVGDDVNYEQGDTFIRISQKFKEINFFITYYYMYVQIGIGWVK